MKTYQFFTISSIAIITLASGLLGSAVHAQPTAPTIPMPAEIVKPMPKSGMDMKQGMDMKPMMTDMHDKTMGMNPTGNADVDFALMMRMHHQGAINMAEAQLQNGKDAQMRAMAKDIIRDQKKEIAVFDKFLAKRGDAGMKMGEPGMPMKN